MSLQVETVYLPEETDTHEVAKRDHAKDMKMIGDGLYSKVYGSNGTPYVVKIFRASDRGYRAWIQTLAEIGDLGKLTKYIPKVHKVFLYRYPDECREQSYYYKPGERPSESMVVYLELLKKVENYYNPEEKEWKNRKKTAGSRFAEKMSKIFWEAKEKDLDWKKLRPIHQDLIALLLLAYGKQKSMGFDLHYGNVMIRGKQFVITDPLSGGG